MMIEGAVPNVEHKSVEAVRHLITAQNFYIRTTQLQQRGAENVVRMEFSTMCKSFFGKMQGILAPFIHKIQYLA